MKAGESNLLFIKGPETKYVIPYFQRGYVWDTTNWEQLLTDLLGDSSSHFFGSIIIKEMNRDKNDFCQRRVIDGQQRITTISILIRALYDIVSDEIKKSIKDKIYSMLFVQKDTTKDWEPENIEDKLIPGINDKEAYHIIINNPEKIKDISVDNHIRRCYEFFIKELDEEKAKTIFRLIQKDEIQFVVKIELNHEDNEQAIFDATNSTGVKLTCADIIKNDLFLRFDEREREKIYKDTWETVFDGDDYYFWTDLYNKRANIENLLFAVSEIEIKEVCGSKNKQKINYIYNPYEDTYDVLSNKYKEYFDKNNTQLDKFVERLIKYAKIYKNYLVLNKDQEYSDDEYIPKFILTINRLQISTVLFPYLLMIFNECTNEDGEVIDDKEDRLKNKLYEIECLLLRASVCERINYTDDRYKPSTRNFNKSIVEVINNRDIKRLYTDSQLDTINDDKKIIEGLKNIKNNNTAAIIIFLLNLKVLNDIAGRTAISHFPYSYELEHIMPQKYKEYWGLPKYDEEGNVLDGKNEEELEKIRDSYIYQIGNMTIITPEMNKKISNKEIKTKMYGDTTKLKRNGTIKKGYQGYDICATEPLSEELKSMIKDAGNVWNEKMIKERTETLTKEFMKYWPKLK